MWSLQVPPQVKLTLWRFISKAMPKKMALACREIIKTHEETKCVWCKKKVETDTHLLIHCHKTKKIWKQEGFNAEEMQTYGNSMKE